LGKPLIDFNSISTNYPSSHYEILIAVGYHEMNQQRQRIFKECKQIGYRVASYIHSSVTYFSSEQIGEGVILLDHVCIQPEAHIGENSFIWSNTVIAHGSEVKPHCWIAAGTVVAGDATIGENCFLGVHCTIGHNVNIGNATFVGANTLVAKDTEAESTIISAVGEKVRLNSQQFMKFANV
jgi:sugar O-acyltransferase (sialic acid O-acetyltransferase NeuD family)